MNAMKERRENNRISINHPILYAGRDSIGKSKEQGVGLALDISVDGMMFESNEPIYSKNISISASINKGDTVWVEGLMVYFMPYAEGKYRTAIRFTGEPDQISSFFNQMCNDPG